MFNKQIFIYIKRKKINIYKVHQFIFHLIYMKKKKSVLYIYKVNKFVLDKYKYINILFFFIVIFFKSN